MDKTAFALALGALLSITASFLVMGVQYLIKYLAGEIRRDGDGRRYYIDNDGCRQYLFYQPTRLN